MFLFGVDVPLWAAFLIGMIIVILAWKLIKFAIKILIIIVIFFAILVGLDYFNVFDAIQNFIGGLI